MSRLSTSAGDSARAGGEHGDRAADGVRAELLASAGQRDQLGEDPFGERHVAGRAGQSDLVAPHMDVGVEQLLGDAEVLVARAEQREQCRIGYGEPGLTGGFRMVHLQRAIFPTLSDGRSGGSTLCGSGHVASGLLSAPKRSS